MQRAILVLAKPYDAEMVRRALGRTACRVLLAEAGTGIGERVERDRPAVVVIGLRRMQAEGMARYTEIRAGRHGRDVPVVLVGDPGEAAVEAASAVLRVLRQLETGSLIAAVEEMLAASSGSPGQEEGHGTAGAAASESLAVDDPEGHGTAGAAADESPAVDAPETEAAEETSNRSADDAGEGAVLVLERGAIELSDTGRELSALEIYDEEMNTPALAERSGPATALSRSGDLQLMDLPHLLIQAHRHGLTGRLSLRREEAEKAIFLDGGDPVFALSNLPHDRMGDLLHREGKLSSSQFATAQDLVLRTGRRLGAVLVDQGLIKPRELFPLVRRHVAEIIYSLFSWSEGSYAWAPSEPAPEEKIRLDIHPVALIVEGIRRKYGLDRLLELVGPPETRLMAHNAGLRQLQGAELLEGERRVVELMDGERTLGEIVEVGPLEDLGVYQVAYATLVLGVTLLRAPGELRLLGAETVAAAQRRERSIDRQRIMAKHGQVAEGDYYSLLGLRQDATAHEVRRAYERLREDFDPRALAPEVVSECQIQLAEILEVIEEAYLVLADDGRRLAYREAIR